MAYTDFENVKGGQNGTVKGELPVEDIWDAFAYRKALEVQVFINPGDFGISQVDLKGQWKVRLREDGSRDAQGKLTASVLFEQTITWTARVIALSLGGGLALVTWQPLGDGGSGAQQTSIVDGQACAIVENVNDPAQVDALNIYGQSGAWRFIDTVSFLPNATPRQKYDVERGFSIFMPEGAATVGGYTFHAVWQSSYYRVEVPEGAVLDTVMDSWQSSILTEARYTVSGREGAAGEAFLLDARTGERLHVFVDRSASKPKVVCRRTRQTRGTLLEGQIEYGHGITLETDKIDEGDNGTIERDSRLRGLQLLRLEGNARVCVGATGGNPSQLRAFLSVNRGEDWNRFMNQPLPITPICNCVLSGQTKVLFYGTDDEKKPAYALLERGDDGFSVTKTGRAETTDGSTLPLKGGVSLEAGEGGAIRLFARESSSGTLFVWRTDNEGARWAKEDVN